MTEKPWMRVMAVVPEDVAMDLVRYLIRKHGFVETDWLVLGRRGEKSRVDYDPCPPPDSQVAS